MSERDTLAALLRDEYELGDYWVSKSRLADAAYRGRDPMDDWRGLAGRLIAAGVRLAPAPSDALREAAQAVVDAWDHGHGEPKGSTYLALPTQGEIDALRAALDAEAGR